MGDDRAAALKPAWGFHPQVPSSFRGDGMMVERNQVTLRYLILVFGLCCAWGGTIGASPQAPAGNIVPCTLSSLRGDGMILKINNDSGRKYS